MNVLELIKKRMQSPLNVPTGDKWLEEVATSKEEEVYILLTGQALNYNRQWDLRYTLMLQEEFVLNGIFDLQCPLPQTGMGFNLYVFSKKPSDTVKIGIYKHILTKQREWGYDNILKLPEYPEEFLEYCKQIELWLNDEIMPPDTDDYEFNIIKRNELTPRVFNPRQYSKKVLRIKEALKKEKIVLLNQVAEVMRPRPDKKEKSTSNYLATSAWEYPLSYEKLQEGVVTDITLSKGDIVFISQSRFYLVDEVPDRELYPSPNHLVIRPEKIQPEYLYLYLKSDTGKTVISTYTRGVILPRIRRSDLASIPVILPKNDPKEYQQLFYLQNYKVDDITTFNHINQYFTSLQKRIDYVDLKNDRKIQEKSEGEETSNIEDILEIELANDLRMYKQDVMQDFLSGDLKELNTCFRNKAYKATLILAGSILEAVLIDWLSEIKNKNYFEEDYIMTDRKNGRQKRADLIDYIDEIKEIERPYWMEEAAKAHTIRQKRNLVHAKLCIRADEINEVVCRQVIDYLRDVLKTRGIR